MTAVPSSVAPSLASEYAPNRAWLAQDKNPTGKGPVATGPASAVAQPWSGTAPVPLNPSPFDWTEAELTVQAPDYFPADAAPHEGPWPAVPDAAQGKEPWGTWPDDGHPEKGYYRVPPKIEGLEQTHARLPGHDRHSQDVDSAGWEQYTPTGRVAVRQGWWQDYLGVDYFWPRTQPNLARTKVAAGGDQNVGGTVAEYGGLANSGGNIAYEPPAPPPVSALPPAGAGPGTIPQWGF